MVMAISSLEGLKAVNTSHPGENDRQFGIFMNKKFGILTRISMKFIPESPIYNKSAGNGLVPNKWQAIIWTIANPFHWCI